MVSGKLPPFYRVMILKGLFTFILVSLLTSAYSALAQSPEPSFEVYAHGRYVYERNCIICHGLRGDGKGELGETLIPKPRSFREGMFKFRTTPWDKLPTDDNLRRTITGGLSGTAMGMFTQLQPDEVTAVIEYVKSFSRRWRTPENYAEPLKFPAPPAWLNDGRERASQIVAGKVLFTNICATCHGPNADGNGPTAATLKDATGFPFAPSDLRQPHLRCGDGPADIYRVLSTGMNGTPMISYAETLTEQQRWQVIAYIISVRVEGPPLLNPSS